MITPIENKESFFNRLEPYLVPSDMLDIKLAYALAKFGHRAQVRKELDPSGKELRYFEHVRRVSLILMDDMMIYDKNMIITAICHDLYEDVKDFTPELIEHTFGSDVCKMIKSLSKMPKEGYIERLNECEDWRVIAIKACDRLDNLRSLKGTSESFMAKQIKETKEKYAPLFQKLYTMKPDYAKKFSSVTSEISNLVINIDNYLNSPRPKINTTHEVVHAI